MPIIYSNELLVQKSGNEFSFDQLSSGEKSIIIMVSEIARRLSMTNEPEPLKGTGIVLIDEIDQHLHPKWQRNIMTALMTTFPNIQFIVTSHSPQVLSGVKKEGVFVLKNGTVDNNDIYTEGRDSNSILQDVFGVPEVDEKTAQELHDIYHCIDEGNTDIAQQKLLKLLQKRGSNDREVVRIQSFIDMI